MYGTEPEATEAAPSNRGFQTPNITLKESQLKQLTVSDRLKFIGKKLYESEISGFAKGAIMHKLLDYTLGPASRNSSTVNVYARALHRLVNFFEIDTVLHGMVTLIGDSDEVESHDSSAIETHIMNVIRQRWFPNTTRNDFYRFKWTSESESPACDTSFTDVFHCLGNLHADVAEKYNCVPLYKEEFKDGETKYALHVFKLNGVIYGLSSRVTGAVTFYAQRVVGFYTIDHNYETHRALFGILDSMSKENFIRIVNPEKNLLELTEQAMQIMPRRRSFTDVPNLPVDELCRSVRYSLETGNRRVIALVGDPGLGKTNAVHTILNAFPQVPAFMVTASAMGYYHSAANVRSIFNAVASIKSILVIDDFDGFDVGEKDDATTEFLLQLEGARGFKGVAILIINDPQKVDRTIIDRPGRVDEVHMIGYLTKHQDVINAIRANYPDADLNEGDSSLQFMIDHRFSTARIVGAAEYAFVHFGKIDNNTVADSAEKLLLFQHNATSVVLDGRLVKGGKQTKPKAIGRKRRGKVLRTLGVSDE